MPQAIDLSFVGQLHCRRRLSSSSSRIDQSHRRPLASAAPRPASVSPRAPAVRVETRPAALAAACATPHDSVWACGIASTLQTVPSRGDLTKAYSLIGWATKMHGFDSCASMACMHGFIQLARQETRRSWDSAAAVFSFFPLPMRDRFASPTPPFHRDQGCCCFATTTLSDITVYRHHQRLRAVITIVFLFKFYFYIFFSFGRRVCWLFACTRALSHLAPRSLP